MRLRGDGAEVQVITRKGLRWRLRRHGLEIDRCRLRLRVAVGRARVMGPQGAVEIVYRRSSWTRRTLPPPAELVDDYIERYANPYVAAERGYVDAVIDPADTRRVLVRALQLLASKREDSERKHGNLPL